MENNEVLKGQLDIFGIAEGEKHNKKLVEFIKDRTDACFLFTKGAQFEVYSEDKERYTIKVGEHHHYSLYKNNFKVIKR